jgi:hypothetical protein
MRSQTGAERLPDTMTLDSALPCWTIDHAIAGGL